MSEQFLRGKHVLVTGGSRGIGKAIVLTFARMGAKVTFVYNKSQKHADGLIEFGKENNYIISAVKFDLMDYKNIDDLIDKVISMHGNVQILINNAGIKIRTSYFESSVTDWENTLSTNLSAVHFLTQAVAKRMIGSGSGNIINIASQAGIRHVTKSVEYGISKAGVIYLTQSLARILAPWKITVNAVSPGYTYTDMIGHLQVAGKEMEKIKNIPLKKINSPEEVAMAVLFFARDEASNITGQVLGIDGGEGVY